MIAITLLPDNKNKTLEKQNMKTMKQNYLKPALFAGIVALATVSGNTFATPALADSGVV